MITQVLMPKIGLAMTEEKIIDWKKKEEEWIEKGKSYLRLKREK